MSLGRPRRKDAASDDELLALVQAQASPPSADVITERVFRVHRVEMSVQAVRKRLTRLSGEGRLKMTKRKTNGPNGMTPALRASYEVTA